MKFVKASGPAIKFGKGFARRTFSMKYNKLLVENTESFYLGKWQCLSSRNHWLSL